MESQMSNEAMKEDCIRVAKKRIEGLENTPTMFRNARYLEMLDDAKKLLALLEDAPV